VGGTDVAVGLTVGGTPVGVAVGSGAVVAVAVSVAVAAVADLVGSDFAGTAVAVAGKAVEVGSGTGVAAAGTIVGSAPQAASAIPSIMRTAKKAKMYRAVLKNPLLGSSGVPSERWASLCSRLAILPNKKPCPWDRAEHDS
jgi:hypothetical protein